MNNLSFKEYDTLECTVCPTREKTQDDFLAPNWGEEAKNDGGFGGKHRRERGKRKCRQKEETEVSDQVTSFQCHPLIWWWLLLNMLLQPSDKTSVLGQVQDNNSQTSYEWNANLTRIAECWWKVIKKRKIKCLIKRYYFMFSFFFLIIFFDNLIKRVRTRQL